MRACASFTNGGASYLHSLNAYFERIHQRAPAPLSVDLCIAIDGRRLDICLRLAFVISLSEAKERSAKLSKLCTSNIVGYSDSLTPVTFLFS